MHSYPLSSLTGRPECTERSQGVGVGLWPDGSR